MILSFQEVKEAQKESTEEVLMSVFSENEWHQLALFLGPTGKTSKDRALRGMFYSL